MKKSVLFTFLLTILIGLLPSAMAYSQTYTISPSGYTTKPSYQTLGGIWTGYTSGSDPVWIETKAEQSGSSVKFTVRKSSGSFNNSVSFEIRRDITVSGSNITNKGTYVESGSISSGRSSGTCTITPASGSHEYRVILTSGSIVFYTRIITITASSSLDTPDYTKFSYSNVTSTGFRAIWAAVSGATKYNILVKRKSDTDYSNPVFEAYNKTTTYCDVTGLQPNSSYQFQVQAINNTEKSSWSKSIQTAITTSGGSTSSLSTPDYTKFSYSDVTSTSFVARWEAVSGATQYDVLVKKSSDSDYSNPAASGGSSSPYYRIQDLEPNTSYQFQVRAKNNTTKSTWSKSIQTPIKTANVETAPANLSIVRVAGFTNTSSFTVGTPAAYRVFVQNNGTADWTGSFYLKEGDKDIKGWGGKTIKGTSNGKYSAVELPCYYTPENSGTKTLTLYYQTGGQGKGEPVNANVSSWNPMQITVKVDPSVNTALKLSSAISAPTTTELGKTSNVNAKVKNTGSDSWSGTIYLTDNEEAIASIDNLGVGEEKPVFANWIPQTAGTHSLAVYYKSKNSTAMKLLDANGFTNPVSVTVSSTNVLSDASKVVVKHLTKDVVPKEVTPGSNVYYYFRLLDENGKFLKNMKLSFGCSGGNKTQIESLPSDADGYAVLCLETSGSNAIASRGQTCKLSCAHAINESGKIIQVKGNVATDMTLSLKVHQGNTFSEGSGTENVEKAELTLELGASGKADWKAVKFKAGAGAALTTKLGIKFDETGKINEYSVDGGIKGSLSASLGESSSNPLTELGIDGSYGESLLTLDAIKGGVQANVRWGSATSDPLDLIVRFIMSYVYNYTEGTSRVQDMAVKAMRHWYADKRMDSFSWSWSIGGSASVSGKILSCWPAKNVARPLIMPIVKYADLGVSGEGSFAVEPNIVRESWNSSYEGDNLSSLSYGKLSGTSSTLKLKGEFDAKLEIGKIWNDTKSWWTTSIMHQFHKGKLGETFPSVGYSYDKTLSLKHEEMYDEKNLLREVSQSFGLSSGWEISADKVTLGSWGPGDYSFGISNKTTSKISSKGDWATFLARVSVPDGSESYLTQLLQGLNLSTNNTENYRQQVFKVFPNLARNTLICSPAEIYNAWKGDFDKPLSILANITPNPQNYKLNEALKLEEKVTSEMDFNASIKVYDWKVAKFYIDGGLTFGIDNRPSSVSYYSLPDRRFFTVVQRPTTSIEQTADWMVDFTSNKINEAFEACKSEILGAWDWLKDKYNYVVDESERLLDKAGDWIENNIFFPIAYHQLMKERNGANARLAVQRHPRLAEKEQVDICKFSVGINKDEKNFDAGVIIEIPHYYPAGDLLGVTDQGDTIFVVSEVCDLIAIQGTDTLKTTQYGQFSIEGISGADDLTPFGFREDQALDVYYSEIGNEIWHYVGPAGTTIKTNKLGTYMMGTSIKNDVIEPEINTDFDDQAGIIHISVKENIGLRPGTLSIILNGEAKEFTMINESNFEVELSEEEMQYMLNLNVSIYDLAGNLGSMSQVFQLDKPEKINIEDQPDTDISELENTIYTESVSATSGGDVILSVKMKNSVEAESFQFDLELPEGISVVQDEDGFAEAELSLGRTSKKKTDTFTSAFLENGALRVIAGSTGGYSFSGNDGEVATIKLHIDKNVPIGNYPIVLRNISISDTNAESHDVAYVKSTIYVGEGLIGDVNGDDVVNAQDVVDLILYMMGKKQLDFNAADVNGDGVINSADVIMVSNSILKN